MGYLERYVTPTTRLGGWRTISVPSQVDREVYSCLTSMFDEDEKQARQIKEAGPVGAAVEAARAREDTGGGVCNEGGGKNNDNDEGEGGSGGSSGNEEVFNVYICFLSVGFLSVGFLIEKEGVFYFLCVFFLLCFVIL